MNIKEIKELIEAVAQNGITELEVERTGVKVRIRKQVQSAQVPVAAVSPGSTAVAIGAPAPGLVASENGSTGVQVLAPVPVEGKEDLYIVRSPIVGTFYRAPNPNAEPFVKVGDVIEPGRVLCIVEAMKLMNEIEAEVAGEIASIFIENGEPVEFGQALFGIRPVSKP
jgi:acetyl-CoA carboxylase biotin carboxyl carrier protein